MEEASKKAAKKAINCRPVNLRANRYKKITESTPHKAKGSRAAKVVWPKRDKENAWI